MKIIINKMEFAYIDVRSYSGGQPEMIPADVVVHYTLRGNPHVIKGSMEFPIWPDDTRQPPRSQDEAHERVEEELRKMMQGVA